MRQQGRGDEEAVENREAHGDALPRPVAAGRDCGNHDHEGASDGDRRTDAEKSQAGAYADKFRDEREKISEYEVGHREKSPETPEAVEDQLGMAAMSDRSQAHGHFLHDVSHQESQNDERYEKPDAKARAIGRIGKHARRVVLAEENENAGPDQEPEHAEAAKKTRAVAFPSGAGYLPAIVSAVYVLVRELPDELSGTRGPGGGLCGGMRGAIA